ncbi:hypothetical protein SCHPADRAFT_614537 [Schizopora paradoxa]|uniref:Uncharacterized protein n=1 Tax=Schizopora paradoxa TaxID=27342 RepID=A0A0H2R8U8_9AGAM|nr:hypothetical protein SCHPADRAFT_614537 [Schizopora paradoxa]
MQVPRCAKVRTAVVSDTVDRLEKRTVPESTLPPNDPTSYNGTHARRRFVPLGFDLLPPPTPWILVSAAAREEQRKRKHTLTRRKNIFDRNPQTSIWALSRGSKVVAARKIEIRERSRGQAGGKRTDGAFSCHRESHYAEGEEYSSGVARDR